MNNLTFAEALTKEGPGRCATGAFFSQGRQVALKLSAALRQQPVMTTLLDALHWVVGP